MYGEIDVTALIKQRERADKLLKECQAILGILYTTGMVNIADLRYAMDGIQAYQDDIKKAANDAADALEEGG